LTATLSTLDLAVAEVSDVDLDALERLLDDAPIGVASDTPDLPTPVDSEDADEFDVAVRMRKALLATFFLFGVFVTSWMGRLPSIREALSLTDGEIGRLIVLGSIGGLIAVTTSGVVIPRLGSRRALWVGMFGALLGMSLIGAGVGLASLPIFSVGLLLNGLSNPLTNVTANIEGARLEKILGKAVLPQMHAAFPVGAALGSALAAGSSALHIPPYMYVIGIAVAVSVARVFLINSATAVRAARTPQLVKDSSKKSSATDRNQKRFTALAAWTEPRTLLIGVVLFAATMSEGSASNWLNIAVVDAFHAREALGALAYGTFVISMLSVRLLGARLIARFSRVPVLYASGTTALVGLLLFGLSPALPLAWLGIVFWGMGAAMAWPIAMAASADDADRASARVAVTSSFSSVAMLVVPPILGLLADSWGARTSLLLITIAMVFSLLATRAAREPEAPAAA